ncbi:efflux RND transporter permease subunit [Venatoribacter cucullus]|uniref:efflux RND transporter permease subunit n=1 Tax=Venatoribacter cucullus TaxID=2661630 RepID=UPI00223F9807|nr:efflux RND transporter permease subunit [Venatoribacter cucullus]UZK03296.1 hypothetical protein GAY96_04965 [Venatoribacter cucullus]
MVAIPPHSVKSHKTSSLPPGATTPLVMDDFGDVYGVLLAITGADYSYQELSDYADYLKRELSTLNGVAKVEITGTQKEQVFIDISRERMTNLGIPLSRLVQLLQTQNTVQNAGHIRIGDDYIRIHPTGEFRSVQELGDLRVSPSGSDKLIYLRDLAHISEGIAEVPSHLTHFRGTPSLRLGIAFNKGVNVVAVGEQVRAQLVLLDANRPLGIELHTLYDQPAEVDASSTGFVLNLLASVIIVIAVLLVFMGLRAGVIIGIILLLTVFGTFIAMRMLGIELQRISLGALIIALGMLVDNALVITEGIMVGLQRGLSRTRAAYEIVKQTQWPLLGATVIAITAFAPIGLSPDSTGEFVGSLFWACCRCCLIRSSAPWRWSSAPAWALPPSSLWEWCRCSTPSVTALKPLRFPYPRPAEAGPNHCLSRRGEYESNGEYCCAARNQTALT